MLLLVATTSYRTDDFIAAAQRLGVEVTVGTDRCLSLAKVWPEEAFGTLALDFRHPARAVRAIERAGPFAAVVATSDDTAVLAALAARALGLPGNAPEAARAARNKRVMRAHLRLAGVPCPEFAVFPAEADPRTLELPWPFPVVVKPLLLSASRGVIRADDREDFAAAFARVGRLLARPELAQVDDDLECLRPPRPSAGTQPARRQILVERFVPGMEVALEGVLSAGALRVLALFDKPDPLDGPFFEETIYVTPSRLPAGTQSAIAEVTARAAAALGLRQGPIHAELRLSDGGPVVIEVAARSIGGLCSRTLRFGLAGSPRADEPPHSLEEIVIAHALDLDASAPRDGAIAKARDETASKNGASGVMMVPIPKGGVLQAVEGVEEARAVPRIEDVVISMKVGERVVPLPEGAAYLGFLFARAPEPAEVEAALREAHRRLRFTIAATL